MSFLGGAECSTGANPLAQFTKHVQDDKSLQRDRLAGRGPAGVQESMRSQLGVPGAQDKMMEDFMQQTGQVPEPATASPFAMEQMRRELEHFQPPHLRSQSGSPAWAAEFDPQMEQQADVKTSYARPQNGRFDSADFARFQHSHQNGASGLVDQTTNGQRNLNPYQSRFRTGYGMDMGMGGMGMGMMGNRSFQPQPVTAAATKGKGRMVELDDENWESQFAQIDAEGRHDLDAEANAAMERELEDMDRSVLSETNELGDFESIWRGIQAETASARGIVDENMLNEGIHMGDFDQWDGFDGLGTHGGFNRDPPVGEYLFEEENIFNNVGDPFGEGVRIMDEGGNLSLAALAFEVAVQRDPQHIEAWTMLGSAQAQNEKESPAIRALEQALKIDPSNLAALMGLAVSYTNEGYDSTAYRTLERWLSIKYPTLLSPDSLSTSADIGFTDRHQLHEKVTDLFIRAAQLSPSSESMDPDVQVGLGVLFYGAEEYTKAVDCFSAALASTESGTTNASSQLHLLWNRLGATLANSGRSEEAITAYEKALTLRPNFVRARYNLGVSCINIGCFEEAAQHLLGALSMHRVVEREGMERVREVLGGGGGGGGAERVEEGDVRRMVAQYESTNLFDTLRRVFMQMGRRDLSESVGPGMDVERFRGEFDF
ncbi:MAG: Peroxisomal membrane signal receptor PTS1 [Piccolia ochrophora]|nr:MAG: Peroxisomal membrane signal receptor PTS1 [Piccolia ochrophora]